MDKIYFTGIGSRQTPEPILHKMMQVAYDLCQPCCGVQYVLRSGKAGGADEAFQSGVECATHDFLNSYNYNNVRIEDVAEIYTPWPNFKNDNLLDIWDITPDGTLMAECQEIAKSIHPAWDYCKQGARKLHGRNVCQVLGKDLNTPSSFVLFYADEDKNGNVKGGTATAVNLARREGIPTINMLRDGWEDVLYMVLLDLGENINEK